jgi:hypothetical protein
VGLNTHETLKAKKPYKQNCYKMGVGVQSYHPDNGTFASQVYEEDLKILKQHQKFAGIGAHHQNEVAECAIQTIMSMGRNMMTHAFIRWSDMQNLSHWPMAVDYAIHIYNHTLSPTTGIASIDIMIHTHTPCNHLTKVCSTDIHTCWGCPTYVLSPALHDGKKLPQWKPRSHHGMFLGFSPKQHAHHSQQ